jgi:hypothetical protein
MAQIGTCKLLNMVSVAKPKKEDIAVDEKRVKEEILDQYKRTEKDRFTFKLMEERNECAGDSSRQDVVRFVICYSITSERRASPLLIALYYQSNPRDVTLPNFILCQCLSRLFVSPSANNRSS